MRSLKPICFALLLAAMTISVFPVGAQVPRSGAAVSKSPDRLVLIEVNGDFAYERFLSSTIADLIRRDVPGVTVSLDFSEPEELNLPQVIAYSMVEDISMLGRNPSLLIFVGAEAWLEYKSMNHPEWADIPIVLCDVPDSIPVSLTSYYEGGSTFNDVDLEPVSSSGLDAEDCGKLFSVIQKTDYYSNLRLIKSLYPEVSTIYYYSEKSIADEYDIRHLRYEAAENFGSLKIESVRRGSMYDRELADSLRKCSEDGVVMMRESYSFLGNKEFASPSKPYFTVTDCGPADVNSLGGLKVDCGAVSKAVAEAAAKMLGSEAPALGNVTLQDNVCKINGTCLHDYGLDRAFSKSDFSRTASYYNAPESFFRRYIVLIFIIVLFIAATLVIIAAFVFADVNRTRSRKLISKFKNLYEHSMLIYNNMPIPLVQYASDGKVLKATPSALRLFKANPEFWGLESNCFENGLVSESAIAGSPVRDSFEKTVNLKASGTSYRVIFYPVANEGKPGRYLLILIDCTRLEKERNRLSYLSDSFVFSMNQIGVGVVEFGPDRKMLFSTDPWFNLFGVSQNTSIRDSFSNLFEEDRESVMSCLDKVDDGSGIPYSAKVRVRYAPDKFHWLEVRFVGSVTEEGDHIIMGMARNIDKDVARADAIRASLDAAKASGQLKSKFVANMSHEIKTPLNAIVGFTDLLTSSEDSQEKQMYVHFITENNNSLLELIDSILNIPASEGKGVKLNKENFDLNDMMEEIAYATRLSVDSDKIQVTFRMPYDSMVIYQDRNKLKEAVSNLSGNSAKYTKQGNITLDYNLDAAGWLTITVSDTGIGITDEDQKNIFRRYVRVGETDAEGHGLGLSIIQQIISAMGGVVGVRSKLGEGSTFWIKIKKEVEQ